VLEVISATANVVIFLGYAFAAFYVGPKIKGTTRWTKLSGAGFFLSCGAHHLHGAMDVLRTPETTVREFFTVPHALWLIDVPQAFFIWAFLLGLAHDLFVHPRRAIRANDA